jgi:5-methylcytosine-specific restriction protein A
VVVLGRCGQHARRPWKHAAPSRHARGYGYAWVQVRAEVLREQPICTACHAARSTTVDHIIPKADGGTDARGNLRGLCKWCHQRKSGREGGRRLPAC